MNPFTVFRHLDPVDGMDKQIEQLDGSRALMDRGKTKTQKALARWLPSAILIFIAFIQMFESHFGTLTPWKGGGFGMFSTYDSVDNRFLKAYLLTNHGANPCLIPEALSRQVTVLQTKPTVQQLNDLAQEMLEMHWYETGEAVEGFSSERFRKLYPNCDIAADRPRVIVAHYSDYSDDHALLPIQLFGVRVEVWRWQLNNSTLSARPWMQLTKEVPATQPAAGES